MPTLSNVIKSVGLVTIIAAIGKVLGFGRESIIAAYFGASSMADVFFSWQVSYQPFYLRLSAAVFRPALFLFTWKKKADNPKKADEFISVLGSFFMLVAGVLNHCLHDFHKAARHDDSPGFLRFRACPDGITDPDHAAKFTFFSRFHTWRRGS
ncbi:hypothetical protein RCO48_13290 [Peribacillus frigoritolerans]|nr:hypothetical protein [Peribacillus frigoritolerans]